MPYFDDEEENPFVMLGPPTETALPTFPADVGPLDPGPPVRPPNGGALRQLVSNPGFAAALAQILSGALGGRNGGYMGQGIGQGFESQQAAARQSAMDRMRRDEQDRQYELERRRTETSERSQRSQEEGNRLSRERLSREDREARIKTTEASVKGLLERAPQGTPPERLGTLAARLADINGLSPADQEYFYKRTVEEAGIGRQKDKEGYVLTGRNDLVPETEFDKQLKKMPGDPNLVRQIAESGALGTRYPELGAAERQQSVVEARRVKPDTSVQPFESWYKAFTKEKGREPGTRDILAYQEQLKVRPEKPKSDLEALADVVMQNPAFYQNNLTRTKQAELAPILSARGFTGFGKPLSETALKEIRESKDAIASLKDLRQTLVDNEQYIGPIAGLQALNPYSDARKAQARIDVVRQRVGKALEGGVLRKEDEYKYKQILATLRDEPSTAIYKVDHLVADLEASLGRYLDLQAGAGRDVKRGSTDLEKALDRILKAKP